MAENPHKHTRGHFIHPLPSRMVSVFSLHRLHNRVRQLNSIFISWREKFRFNSCMRYSGHFEYHGVPSVETNPQRIETQDLVRTLFTTRNAGQGARTSYPSSTSLRSQPNSNWFSFSPQGWKEAEERISWIYFPVGTESTGKHVCRKLPANKTVPHYFTLTARYALPIRRIYHCTNVSPSCNFCSTSNRRSQSCKQNGRRLPRFMHQGNDTQSTFRTAPSDKNLPFPIFCLVKGENSWNHDQIRANFGRKGDELCKQITVYRNACIA